MTVLDDGDGGPTTLEVDTWRAGRRPAFSTAGDDSVHDAFLEEQHRKRAMPAGEHDVVLRENARVVDTGRFLVRGRTVPSTTITTAVATTAPTGLTTTREFGPAAALGAVAVLSPAVLALGRR